MRPFPSYYFKSCDWGLIYGGGNQLQWTRILLHNPNKICKACFAFLETGPLCIAHGKKCIMFTVLYFPQPTPLCYPHPRLHWRPSVKVCVNAVGKKKVRENPLDLCKQWDVCCQLNPAGGCIIPSAQCHSAILKTG